MNLVVHQPFFAAFFFHHFSFWFEVWMVGTGSITHNQLKKHWENITVRCSSEEFPFNESLEIHGNRQPTMRLPSVDSTFTFTRKEISHGKRLRDDRKSGRCSRCRVSQRTAKTLIPRAKLRRREKPVEDFLFSLAPDWAAWRWTCLSGKQIFGFARL